jgi:hypothetical protein
MAIVPLLNQLASLFNRKHAAPAQAAPTQVTPTSETPTQATSNQQTATQSASEQAAAPTATRSPASQSAPTSSVPALNDPIVAQANQELAMAQAQPVPSEEEQLVAEQHSAWAAYDFERCIVIFSRLLELHPGDEGYKEKLVTSYFNRGKQYESAGDERRATQLYYSALSLDPQFTPAQEAAEQFLARVDPEGAR